MAVRWSSGARAAMALPVMLTLGACESSSRLGSLLPDDTFRPAPRQAAPAPEPLTPAPSSTVESSSLPPPPGASAATNAPVDPLPAPGQGGAAAGNTVTAPGAPNPPGTNPAAPRAPAPQVATAPAAPVAPPNRSGLVGNWSVSESSGAKCRITLSSAPKLDLYSAGTSGCQSKELQRVNSWELAGNEVILYEPGGGVVARLRQAGAQNYNGATAKSGAPVSITK